MQCNTVNAYRIHIITNTAFLHSYNLKNFFPPGSDGLSNLKMGASATAVNDVLGHEVV